MFFFVLFCFIYKKIFVKLWSVTDVFPCKINWHVLKNGPFSWQHPGRQSESKVTAFFSNIRWNQQRIFWKYLMKKKCVFINKWKSSEIIFVLFFFLHLLLPPSNSHLQTEAQIINSLLIKLSCKKVVSLVMLSCVYNFYFSISKYFLPTGIGKWGHREWYSSSLSSLVFRRILDILSCDWIISVTRAYDVYVSKSMNLSSECFLLSIGCFSGPFVNP